MDRTKTIQRAICSALGCTKIDYRSPKKIDDAAAQITRFVERALDELAAENSKIIAAAFGEQVNN